MKLAIVGYGKMGRLIEQLAPEYGFSVHAKIDLDGDFAQADGADVAVEFTVPHAVPDNVEKLAALGHTRGNRHHRMARPDEPRARHSREEQLRDGLEP